MSTLTELLAGGRVVHAPGVTDAVTARLAAQAGAPVLYVSGAGVSATRLGLPDLGFVHGDDIAAVASLVGRTTGLDVIADADTGYGSVLQVAETVRRYRDVGIAALHIEDQVAPKRCGHLAGKDVVDHGEAVARVAAAVSAAAGEIVVIARTDAWSVTGPDDALHRATSYLETGADLVFVEGACTVADLDRVAEAMDGAPLVFNRSEAGPIDPGLDDHVLAARGVRLVIHPVAALLAAAQAVRSIYRTVQQTGFADAPDYRWSELLDLLDLDELLGEQTALVGEDAAPAAVNPTRAKRRSA